MVKDKKDHVASHVALHVALSDDEDAPLPERLGPPYRKGGETGTAWKRRRKAQRAYVRGLRGAASGVVLPAGATDDEADAAYGRLALLRAKDVAGLGSRGLPEMLRAEKSARASGFGHGVRLSAELPSGIRMLLSKDALTAQEGADAGRFRADYDLAYYSTPGMTTNYEQSGGGGGAAGGVSAARAAVIDARERMRQAEEAMTPGCWHVLTQMVCHDIAQVKVGGTAARSNDPKVRRIAARILLIEALGALRKIYG